MINAASMKNMNMVMAIKRNSGENSHDHGHSHEHGEDCSYCAPGKRILTAEDMNKQDDTPMPERKKKALSQDLDPTAAPFGGNWNSESKVSAKEKSDSHHDHKHGE